MIIPSLPYILYKPNKEGDFMSYKNNEPEKFAKRKGLLDIFSKNEKQGIDKDEHGMPTDVYQDKGSYEAPKMIPVEIGDEVKEKTSPLTFYTKNGPYFGKVTLDLVLKNYEKAVNYGPIISIDAQKKQIRNALNQMRKSYQNRTKEEFEVSLEKISEELQDKLSEMTKGRIGYSIERLMLSPRDDLNIKDYIEKNKKAKITHNKLTEENNKINKELERKQSELKKTELKKDNLDKENGQLRNEVSEQKKMLEEMYKEQKQGYEAYTQLEKNISKTQDILSEKRKELNGIEIEVADKKEDLELLVEDLDKYQDIKEKQAEEIAKLTDTYLNIETEKTALEKTIAKNKGDMTYLSEKLMDLNKEKERNKAEIEATKTTYIQLSKDKAVLDCELNEKRKEMTALDGTLKNWSEIKEKHTSTIFGLEQQITDKRLEKENLEQQTQNYVNEIQRLNDDIKEKSELSRDMGEYVEKFSINLDGMELDAIYSAIKPKAEFLMESNPETYMKGNAAENKEILEKILMEGAIKAFKNDKTKKYRTDELIAFVSPERRDQIATSVKKRKYSDMVVM